MDKRKVEFTSQDWVAPAPGVRMKVSRQGDTQLRLVEFASDFVEPDWCLRGHAGYLLDGRLEVDFNGHIEVFEAGDGILIPPGKDHRHKTRALTRTATVVLMERLDEPRDVYPSHDL